MLREMLGAHRGYSGVQRGPHEMITRRRSRREGGKDEVGGAVMKAGGMHGTGLRKITDKEVKLALLYLKQWGTSPAFDLKDPPYWLHLHSQMYFINMIHANPINVPFEKSQMGRNKAYKTYSPDRYKIDFTWKMERREEVLNRTKELFPAIAKYLPNHIDRMNVQAGRTGGASNNKVSLSCDTAWKIYEHFKQDFVCLGYEMPEECLKPECKPKEGIEEEEEFEFNENE